MPKPVEVATPSDREITVTRVFDAPRQLIWDCHTVPELMQRWLFGPPGWSMPVCKVDLRVGGRYRYIWRETATGRQFGAFGEHREVKAPERLVTVEIMDGFDGRPMEDEPPIDPALAALNTLTLVERDGGCVLTVNMVFPSKEARDMALKSGMSDGMATGYDRLEDEILAEQRVG
jgi:uncharacterized protein YndB with AHSA1/START domain